jgi:methylamine utilization protein MauE
VVAETAFRSLSLFFAALLALAISHKLQLLRTGRAAAQPLIKSHGLDSTSAALALTLALIVEAAIIAMLILWPEFGLPATASIFVVYAFELRRLSPQETCGCFGDWLAATRRAQAIRRNLLLGGLATIGGVVYQADLVDPVGISQASAGATILVAAVVVPLAMRRGVSQRPSVLT